MFVHLLWELGRHGVWHQRRGRVLLALGLGEREGWVTAAILCRTFGRSKLLWLEAVLSTKVSRLVVEAGLSVAVVAVVRIASPIASVLGV